MPYRQISKHAFPTLPFYSLKLERVTKIYLSKWLALNRKKKISGNLHNYGLKLLGNKTLVFLRVILRI